MKKITDLGYDLKYIHEKQVSLNKDIIDIDVLVCYNPFDRLNISKLKNLKWIQLSSIGIDQIPVKYIKNKNIILTNNKGGYSIPMGEWIVLKILELSKNSKQFYQKEKNKTWKIDTSITELYGKTIGFIGTGSIAHEAAKRLQGFETKIFGLNTQGKDMKYFDRCFGIAFLKEMVSLCDILIISVPYTSQTHHLINDEIFQTMKKGVCIINIARGSIIDEKAMIKYLQNGKIKGAALDVFESEPLGKEHIFWELENVIVTPHNSWVSEMRNQRRFNIIYENMKRFIKNEPLLNIVDITKGY